MKNGLAIVALGVWMGMAGATSGGLDKNGCHQPKRGEYHCHPKKEEKVQTKPSAIGDAKKSLLAPSKMGKYGVSN